MEKMQDRINKTWIYFRVEADEVDGAPCESWESTLRFFLGVWFEAFRPFLFVLDYKIEIVMLYFLHFLDIVMLEI